MTAPVQYPSRSPSSPSGPRVEPLAAPARTRPTSYTSPLYEAFSASIQGDAVVWDIACGDGLGTAQLLGEGRQVLGIEGDPHLLAQAKRHVPQAAFESSLEGYAGASPDVLVMVDVLASVSDPHALLVALGRLAKPTSTLLIAEPRAHISQQLRAPRQRAFSDADLQEVLFAAGWTQIDVHQVADTFAVVSAQRADTALASILAQGNANGSYAALEQLLSPWLQQEAAPDLQARLHVHLARSAMHAGDGDSASQHYLAALQCAPELPSALSGLAQLTLSCGNAGDALRLTARCLETHPTHVPALHLWLHTAGQTDRDEQLRTCQALANLTPSDPEIQAALAQLHAETGNADLAIQDLELLRCYQSEPNANLAITLALLLDAVGRRADAQVEAKLAALLAPDVREVTELLLALDVPPSRTLTPADAVT